MVMTTIALDRLCDIISHKKPRFCLKETTFGTFFFDTFQAIITSNRMHLSAIITINFTCL